MYRENFHKPVNAKAQERRTSPLVRLFGWDQTFQDNPEQPTTPGNGPKSAVLPQKTSFFWVFRGNQGLCCAFLVPIPGKFPDQLGQGEPTTPGEPTHLNPRRSTMQTAQRGRVPSPTSVFAAGGETARPSVAGFPNQMGTQAQCERRHAWVLGTSVFGPVIPERISKKISPPSARSVPEHPRHGHVQSRSGEPVAQAK